MKDDILQRAMFAMPLSPQAQNSGILSGFMDEEPMGEEPMSPEDESLEEMPVMARTPQNPEILMNNLRGDMRSLDARYVELAQMVGEQAAMDTPPEVLAMLMGQLGAQQDAAAAPQEPGMGAGIGGLPQGQEMAPPGMMPPDAGMQAPSPEMMPPGMGGSGPFPEGGAEQAPPQNFALGGIVAAGRLAAPYLARAGEGIARGAQQLNQYVGSKFMAPQFTTQVARGPGGQQLVGQARESLRTLPSGQIVQGTGTQFAPLTTMGPMASPTFTQGVAQGVKQGLAPIANLAGRLSPAQKIGLGVPAGLGIGIGLELGSRNRNAPPEAGPTLNPDTSQIPGMDPPVMPVVNTEPAANNVQAGVAAPLETPTDPAVADAVQAPVDNNQFAKNVAAAAKSRTKADRVREGFDDLSPLYKELLGDDESTRKTQALLLLAEAGFKFAGSTKPTMGMALADAASGIPAGLSALAAQRADRESKVKSAALSQAVEDVNAEDAAARALQLQMLKGDYKLLEKQAEGTGAVIKDGGAGLRVSETKNGSYLGASIDPNDPTVQSAVTSRFTLTPNNPFVVSTGRTPQAAEQDKGERIKLTNNLRALDDTLIQIEQAKSSIAKAYGPGAWYSNFENNMLVPILPIKPNVEDAQAKASVNLNLNRIKGNLARVNSSGRDSVQEQQWIDQVLPAKAGQFFQDVEVNLAEFNALQALVQNTRQATLAQLGYVTEELTARPAALGTKNSPFDLPADEQGQTNMLRFLGGTIGKVTDPNALVYLRTPDGTVRPFKTSELRSSLGGQ